MFRNKGRGWESLEIKVEGTDTDEMKVMVKNYDDMNVRV